MKLPSSVSPGHIAPLLLAMADDEFILGHRDSEWTGYGPILEEDIAFSNISQDELGHALVWYSLHESLTSRTPDDMAFGRDWQKFTCCRFVSYPKGDFAYTAIRQYLFDAAEQIRLNDLTESTVQPLRDTAARLLKEEGYHILHSQRLVERLGTGTAESHTRMQAAVDRAFPQALGMFEVLAEEDTLVKEKVFRGNPVLRDRWLQAVMPVLRKASLKIPVVMKNGEMEIRCKADFGGRTGSQTPDLESLMKDLTLVSSSVPGARW